MRKILRNRGWVSDMHSLGTHHHLQPILPMFPRDCRNRFVLGAGLLSGLACASPDVSGPPVIDPATTLRAVTLSAHAITLDTAAPYDTLTLVATARNAAGQPLAGAPLPTFTASDSSVRVSATGVLQARAIVGQVMVIAQLVYQGVRLADTAYVSVTGARTRPTFTTLQLTSADGQDSLPMPVGGFSTLYALPTTKTVLAAALDGGSVRIPGALVAVRLSVPTSQATVPATTTTGRAAIRFLLGKAGPGPLWVYGEATVYGVTLRDSLMLTLTPPQFILYTVDTLPEGGAVVKPTVTVTLGVGAVVWWVSHVSSNAMDVVFDDPSAVAGDPVLASLTGSPAVGGDIAPFEGCAGLLDFCPNVASRQFPTAGTYHWHSVGLGISGTIVVQ
jgi:hypothetical protein